MRKEYRLLAAVLAAGAVCGIAGAFASSLLLLIPAVGLPLAGCVLLRQADRQDRETAKQIEMLEKRVGCDSLDVYFSHLIHGGWYRSEEELRDEGEALGFTFSHGRFVVLTAHLERWGETFAGESGTMNSEAVRHTYFVLRNVFSELLGRKNRQYDAEVEGDHVCIVDLLQTDPAEIDAELRSCAAEAVEFLEEEFGISVTIAFSRPCESLLDLPRGWTECQQILSFLQLTEDDIQVASIADIHVDRLIPRPVNFTRLQAQMLACVRAGDYTGAREAVRYFCAEESAAILQDANSVRFRLFGAVSTILGVLDELRPAVSEELWDSFSLPDSLLACQSLPELQQQTDTIFGKLTALTETEKKDGAPGWVTAMRQYIDENYTDPNLSVYGIAEKFNISASHCSRVFKQHTGMGALEYIQRQRLEHAKTLLLQASSIKDAAEASGFSNALMMNRAFKRFEGTTPTEFRVKQA